MFTGTAEMIREGFTLKKMITPSLVQLPGYTLAWILLRFIFITLFKGMLLFYCCAFSLFFFFLDSYFWSLLSGPCCWDWSWTLKIHYDIDQFALVNFTGGPQFEHDFLNPIAFMSPLFQVAAIYFKSKTDLTSADDCSTSFTNFIQQVGPLSSEN